MMKLSSSIETPGYSAHVYYAATCSGGASYDGIRRGEPNILLPLNTRYVDDIV